MATFLSHERLEEIRQKVQGGQFKIPEYGTQPLPDSPATGISASGKIIELSTGQVLGSLEQIQGTSNYRATPITPADLESASPLQPVTPQILPPTDISGLIEPPGLTPKEQEESDVNKRLQQINEQLTGKATFEAEKRTEFGVSAAQQAFDDLNRQMRDLQRQQQLVPLTIQQESIGRGRTEAGVEPLEIGRRRALAYDALATASFIDAAQGRLASAERKVNEAIEQKFGPLEAQQRALMANLNLIRESPEASIQDKNRAAKQLAIEEARQKQNEENKAQAKSILDIADQTAAEMARRGTLDAVVLNQIKNAPDDISALTIAAPYLKEEEEEPKTEREVELDTFTDAGGNRVSVLYDPVTRQTRNVVLGEVKRVTAEEPGTPIKSMFTDTQIARGAAVADLKIDEFNQLDTDTQNYFINNEGEIKTRKKIIDDAKFNKEDPISLKAEINNSNLPQVAKDTLIRYTDSLFPVISEESLPWWRRAVNYVTSFF